MKWLLIIGGVAVLFVLVRMMGGSEPDASEPSGRYCMNCHAKIPDGGVVCPSCGGRSFERKGGKKPAK